MPMTSTTRTSVTSRQTLYLTNSRTHELVINEGKKNIYIYTHEVSEITTMKSPYGSITLIFSRKTVFL